MRAWTYATGAAIDEYTKGRVRDNKEMIFNEADVRRVVAAGESEKGDRGE